MKNPFETPLLTDLADHCLNGAVNSGAIIRSLVRAIDEESPSGGCVLPNVAIAKHPAYKIIIGQLSFLAGESLGPTSEALQAFNEWRWNHPSLTQSV